MVISTPYTGQEKVSLTFFLTYLGKREEAADGEGIPGEGGEGTPRHLQRRPSK